MLVNILFSSGSEERYIFPSLTHAKGFLYAITSEIHNTHWCNPAKLLFGYKHLNTVTMHQTTDQLASITMPTAWFNSLASKYNGEMM